jgi:hypothetical protein
MMAEDWVEAYGRFFPLATGAMESRWNPTPTPTSCRCWRASRSTPGRRVRRLRAGLNRELSRFPAQPIRTNRCRLCRCQQLQRPCRSHRSALRRQARRPLQEMYGRSQATRDHPKMSFAETVSMVNFPTRLSTGKGSSIMVPSETIPAGTSRSSWVPILSVLMLMRFSVSCAPLASV